MDLHTLKQCSILWNDGQSTTEIHQSDGAGIQIIDGDVAFSRFDDPEQRKSQAALTCPSTPNDTNLLMGLNGQVHVSQDKIKSRPVSRREVLKCHCPLSRPADWWPLLRYYLWCFTRQCSILQDSLDGYDVGLCARLSALHDPLDFSFKVEIGFCRWRGLSTRGQHHQAPQCQQIVAGLDSATYQLPQSV